MAVPSSENEDFRRWTIGAILLSIALRLVWNGVASPPALPEEARYWVEGQSFAFDYPSASPLSAWLVRLSTDIAGISIFGLRIFAPICHGLTAWLIFITGRRLFGYDEEGPRVGFWAALSWLTLPGVVVSAGFMTDEPALLLCWALALYALARAMEDRVIIWWILLGAALGLGLLTAPVILAFPLGALGYAIFSRVPDGERSISGPLLAACVAMLVSAPMLISVMEIDGWRSGWGTTHSGIRNAALFTLAQFGVFGPILFVALIALVFYRSEGRRDWRMRLLLWLSVPLIFFVGVKTLLIGADMQDAGPAYVAGTLAVCALFVRHNFSKLLQVSVAIGLGVWAGYWSIASLYDTRHAALPRAPDPFKNLRPLQPICEASLASIRSTEAEALLADNRRLLAVCMFEGRLSPERAALWSPQDHKLDEGSDSALRPGDSRRFTYVTLTEDADPVVQNFRDAERVAQVPFRSHLDRTYVATVWQLQGFLGYPDN